MQYEQLVKEKEQALELNEKMKQDTENLQKEMTEKIVALNDDISRNKENEENKNNEENLENEENQENKENEENLQKEKTGIWTDAFTAAEQGRLQQRGY